MSEHAIADADVVIIGGGVAGFWLLRRLRRANYRAILLERDALGSAQTIAAQGIIHSGLKYALQRPSAVRPLQNASETFKQCLRNQHFPLLAKADILSAECLLWSGPRLRSRAFAGLVNGLSADPARKLKRDQYPQIFGDDFAGSIYSMQTPVVDIPSLVNALGAPLQQFIFKVSECNLHSDGRQVSLELSAPDGSTYRLKPRMCVLAAGIENARLLKEAGESAPMMHAAPLRQLMVHAEDLPELHGHYLEPGRQPQLTITSHRNAKNQRIWYVGGALAENCRNENACVLMFRTLTQRIFKNFRLRDARFKTAEFTRAEPVMPRGRVMDGYVKFSDQLSNLVTVWPVKLTLAPSLAPKLISELHRRGLEPEDLPEPELSLPTPSVAPPPWHDFALS